MSGKFEQHIPDYIERINDHQIRLELERLDLMHDCDCEYCDRQGDVLDDNLEEEQSILAQIKEDKKLVISLVAHAKLHGIIVKEQA